MTLSIIVMTRLWESENCLQPASSRFFLTSETLFYFCAVCCVHWNIFPFFISLYLVHVAPALSSSVHCHPYRMFNRNLAQLGVPNNLYSLPYWNFSHTGFTTTSSSLLYQNHYSLLLSPYRPSIFYGSRKHTFKRASPLRGSG